MGDFLGIVSWTFGLQQYRNGSCRAFLIRKDQLSPTKFAGVRCKSVADAGPIFPVISRTENRSNGAAFRLFSSNQFSFRASKHFMPMHFGGGNLPFRGEFPVSTRSLLSLVA